ncbi:MAG: hypothetical protein ACPG4U_10050 [Pseudomonadales bacterium]
MIQIGLPCNEQWICDLGGWLLALMALGLAASFLFHLIRELVRRAKRRRQKKKKH